jgi:hypothetical protein
MSANMRDVHELVELIKEYQGLKYTKPKAATGKKKKHARDDDDTGQEYMERNQLHHRIATLARSTLVGVQGYMTADVVNHALPAASPAIVAYLAKELQAYLVFNTSRFFHNEQPTPFQGGGGGWNGQGSVHDSANYHRNSGCTAASCTCSGAQHRIAPRSIAPAHHARPILVRADITGRIVTPLGFIDF